MERKKRGDTRAGGWCQGGAWELMGHEVAFSVWCIQLLRGTQWFTFWSIPSSAWQGAGTAHAGIWNVQTQLICVVDEHISHNAEGGLEKMSWQLWLQLRCLQVLFCPPERAERQLVCKERTWGVIWRKREMLPSQRWSLQIQKEILKVLNYTRIQKAGKVMSLQ